MVQPDLTQHFLELVRRTSTDLRPDVEQALRAAREREAEGSAAEGALNTILKNVGLARAKSTPICQDTGTPIFYVYYPEGWSTRKLKAQMRAAVLDPITPDPGEDAAELAERVHRTMNETLTELTKGRIPLLGIPWADLPGSS